MPDTTASRGAAPRYRMLADYLMERIASRELPPGSLLPTEQELCDQFNVSRITVRGALQQLQNKGIVSRRAGVGTLVEQPRKKPTFAHLGQDVDEVLLFTKGIPVRVLASEDLTVSPSLAQELDLPAGQRFVHFEVKRQKRSMRPVVYSHHYVPALLAPPAQALECVQVSIADWLAKRNHTEIDIIRQQIAAVTLRKAAAQQLEVKPGAPALKSTRWYRAPGGTLLLASVSLFPGDRYTFESTLSRRGA